MFYSQFILAKKGPLGTIWIAAHLERKLRKNQVADTDIGVSVDSILFPEVPIALRLSSHLLLGVVRIYSRKVNYLFDDCSEALLKIKQAFRSTAVDLPPEESTAPYHSITLPETFDLDDFELPDSDIFQGNYVDHHVSTREQITLQDTMEGVVYSTTQFGLDERFGDGDTSGLDLDEELFLNKVTASGHAGVMLAPDADPRASVLPRTPLKQDKIHGVNENSEVIVATSRVNQLEGLAGNTDFIEYAQAPCTPGLVEEPNLSKTQEASVCDDHLELGEEPNFLNIHEASACDDHPETLSNDRNAVTVLGGQEINQLESQGISASTAGNLLSAELVKAISPASEIPDRNYTEFDGANRLQNLDYGVFSSSELDTQACDGTHSDRTETHVRLDETVTCRGSDETHEVHVLEDPSGNACSGIENISEKSCLSGTPLSDSTLEINQASLTEEVLNNVGNAENTKNSNSSKNSVASNDGSPGRQDTENHESQAYQDPKGPKILNPLVHEKPADMHFFQLNEHLNQSSPSDLGCNALVAPHFPSGVTEPCSMETSGGKEVPHTSGVSTEVQGEGCQATDFIEPVLMENRGTEQASCEDIQADFSKLNDQENNVLSKDNQLENINESENSELPAMEKLLSVPQRLVDLQTNLLAESTPDKTHSTGDVGDAGTSFLSGKKRSFTESTLTVQSLNSVESLGVVQSKRTKESVPDDNDLLSSILVGRRSSVLKMKPTPPPPLEMTSMKRPRSSRVCASKRKVLMDDAMVLHGDVIRQQLTSTDNIRRVRKKAPCTHPEIWMIQKEFLEDDIFTEPIFTGLSTGLALLHSQAYDLSEIRVSQNDGHNAILEAAEDQNLVSQEAVTNLLEASNDMELSMEPNVNKEIGMQGVNESTTVVRSNVEAEPPENQQDENHVLRPQGYDTSAQMEAISDVQEYQNLPHEHSKEIAQIDIDEASDSVADTVNPAICHMIESLSPTIPVLDDKINMPTSSVVPSALLDKEIGFGGSLQIDVSDLLSPDQLDAQSFGREASRCGSSLRGVDAIKVPEENDDSAAVGGTELTARDNPLLGETEGVASVEIEVDLQNSYLAHNNDANPSLAISYEPDGFSNQFVVTIDQATEEIRKNDHGVVSEGDFAAELDHDGKNITSYGSSEEPKIAASYSAELNVDMKNVSIHNGEYPGCYETDPQCTMDAEIANVDHTAAEDHGGFDYTIDGHDTGFLNADDDIAEEDEDFVPSAEQTSFLENSGWSSRTRAVAKYLQVLFHKEAEHGRKVLPMDNLLVGKTRKEASRMFFEALVLKTKDYIHVEQGAPFHNINMKPRVKLMKSDF